jgi:hypothetical protein
MVRTLLVAVLLASCSGPAGEKPQPMPTSVLEHQRPGADTSGNEELSRSEARNWFERLFGLGLPEPAPAARSGGTEYYHGCRGCSSSGDAGLGVVVALLLSRRRRPLTGSSS